jgi:hypothetical protein
MKTTLLLNDETTAARLLLQNAASNKVTVRKTEPFGCNCDRWGHPCPDCDERKIQPKAELPISSPVKKTN